MEEEPFPYGVRCQNSNSCALKTVPGIVFVNLKLHLVEIFTFLKYLLSLKYKRSLFSIFFNIKMNVQGSQVSLRWGGGMTPSISQIQTRATLEATLTQLAKRPYPKQCRSLCESSYILIWTKGWEFFVQDRESSFSVLVAIERIQKSKKSVLWERN